MTKCWIFDLDGTLADISHRRPYVQSKPKNWPAFNAGIRKDKVNEPVAELARMLHASGMKIVISSGREDSMKENSVYWLDDNNIPFDVIMMRKAKDYRSDDIVKKEMLDTLIESGFEPVAVVDDRPRVVNMWRANGLFVFDVNQSGEDF